MSRPPGRPDRRESPWEKAGESLAEGRRAAPGGRPGGSAAWLDLADRRLRVVRLAGDEARPLLVFLHEGLGSIPQWKDFPARLCAATRCPGLLYERRGHGGSSPLAAPLTPRHFHDAADELAAVLERLAAGRDYVLVGHSDGGSVALVHAATQAPRLRGAVTLAAHVFVEERTLDGVRAARAAHAAGKLAGLARHHGAQSDAMFAAWSRMWLSAAFRDWTIEALLPEIVCPLLVLQGLDDAYGTPAQVDAIVRGVRGAEPMLLADCGHAPHLELTGRVVDRIAGFVAGL